MQPNEYKEVNYAEYCKTCKFYEKSEKDDPCFECLTSNINLYSHKPVNYEEDKTRRK